MIPVILLTDSNDSNATESAVFLLAKTANQTDQKTNWNFKKIEQVQCYLSEYTLYLDSSLIGSDRYAYKKSEFV